MGYEAISSHETAWIAWGRGIGLGECSNYVNIATCNSVSFSYFWTVANAVDDCIERGKEPKKLLLSYISRV
jgi:hypothetical protein